MPKRVPPLSHQALAALRPGECPIELTDGYVPGLRVRKLPSGTITWSLNMRDSKGVAVSKLGPAWGLGKHAGRRKTCAGRFAMVRTQQQRDELHGNAHKLPEMVSALWGP